MEDKSSSLTLGLDSLEYEVREGHEVFICGKEIIDAVPWLRPRRNERALTITEVRKRSSEILKDLPKGEGAKKIWESYPPDSDASTSVLTSKSSKVPSFFRSFIGTNIMTDCWNSLRADRGGSNGPGQSVPKVP